MYQKTKNESMHQYFRIITVRKIYLASNIIIYINLCM